MRRAGSVGIGTTTPLDSLHVRFTNTDGAMTGLAVQNLGNTATSYSGMLFYDQNGVLGQFQGFNNLTHEYRINNIARNGSSVLDGSINFMIGGIVEVLRGEQWQHRHRHDHADHELRGEQRGLGDGERDHRREHVREPAHSDFSSGGEREGRPRRRRPCRAATCSPCSGGAAMARRRSVQSRACARASRLKTGPTRPKGRGWVLSPRRWGQHRRLRMTLDPSGNLGIGTIAPSAAVEVVREGVAAGFRDHAYKAGSGGARVATRTARGTAAAPTAIQDGDELGGFGMTGYGATGFGEFGAGMGGFAAENWTDTAQGAGVAFGPRRSGQTRPRHHGHAPEREHRHRNAGGVLDPVIADRLEVFGDIRVGTSGSNGCIKNFAGTGIIGTCASDRRSSRTSRRSVRCLTQLAALQPVHYFWRAADFPQQHFGDSRAYGLIAQDVEEVLPELVVTDEDGFKAVDYTKLPLLTIQAVKELKAENEELKAGNEALKQRVDELERMLKAMLAATAHQ